MTPLTRIQGYGHVAIQYGLEEAIFLDSIVHWYRVNRAEGRNFRDGRWWTYNTIKAFDALFPWWSSKQIRRIIDSCKSQGALLTGDYNQDRRDRTVWYTPSDKVLELYGLAETDKSICPDGQMQKPEPASSCAQTGTALPCSNTHVGTYSPPYIPPAGGSPPEGKTRRRKRDSPEPYKPEWFDAFWAKYPRKDNKQVAFAAWCKLRPDRETCRAMAAGLERAKKSRQWIKDNGDYTPLASTWINQRQWTNQGVDQSLLPTAVDSGGWAPDPEVTT